MNNSFLRSTLMVIGAGLLLVALPIASACAPAPPAAPPEAKARPEHPRETPPATAMGFCAVCGKEMDLTKTVNAGLICTIAGHKKPAYSFCSADCKAAFVEEPTKYVERCTSCMYPLAKAEAEAKGWTSVYEGNTYYMHQVNCKKSFDADPAKYVADLTRDPVCGIQVSMSWAAAQMQWFPEGATSVYKGKTYYFWDKASKATFDEDPAKYAE